MKISAKDGRSGFLKLGTELTKTSAKFDGGWVLIKAKAKTGSYFDTLMDASIIGGKALPVGAWLKLDAWETAAATPLKEGDVVIPAELKLTCWTTDVPNSASRSTGDRTTQCDLIEGRRDVFLEDQVSDSGTINGLYNTASEMQRDLEGNFRSRTIAAAGKATWIPKQEGVPVWHDMVRREMTEAGEVEITLIRKMMITSVDEGQPASGNIPFNFGYETLESQQFEELVA